MLWLNRTFKNESGNVLITTTLSLLVMLAFLAFGVEAGRWYLVRAELSKSVDAGALAGARNISNPNVDPETVAEEFGAENFPVGFLHTAESGDGSVAFDAELIDGEKVRMDGLTDAMAILAELFGIHHVAVASIGAAQVKDVEIMLVLDRSGSMKNQPIADLKTASKSFVDYFKDTQAHDKLGLVSFATSVTVERPLGPNFVVPMNAAIDGMVATGATNAEDAIDQADGPEGFTDQSDLPRNRRTPQFLIFFSDGRPTAFRGNFLYRNKSYNAVACVTGNCEPWDIGSGVITWDRLGDPDQERWLSINPRRTGDGLSELRSKCGRTTTRWNIFDEYPVPGYEPDACDIPYRTALATQVCDLASYMALGHGQELKDKGVTIYTIGLGTVNEEFLEALATGPEQVFYTPSSDQLDSIFQTIAKQIKLRLVM
jgi:hypothetical protein